MNDIIFYSWQSDLPNATNRGFIQTALENAAKAIRKDGSIHVEPVVDRDTLGIPGAPDIASTILAKIDQAEVFVCDASIISQGINSRPAPNPNVLIELGYAMKALGSERIIMVMNLAFGKPELLPFDLRMRRVISYNMPEESEDRATERKKLESSLEFGLRTIFTGPDRQPLENTLAQLPEPLIRLIFALVDVSERSQTLDIPCLTNQSRKERNAFDYVIGRGDMSVTVPNLKGNPLDSLERLGLIERPNQHTVFLPPNTFELVKRERERRLQGGLDGFNLTDNQKKLLCNLVRMDREGKLKGPMLYVTRGFGGAPESLLGSNENTVEFEWPGDLIGDLNALCNADLMSFDWAGKNKHYRITQAGYDAVGIDSDFPTLEK